MNFLFLENYIFRKQGKQFFRKIFEKVAYDEFEEQKISELKKEIEHENIQIPVKVDREKKII